MDDILKIAFWLVAAGLFFWLCIMMPADMAEKRNRNQLGWIIVSLIGSPMLAVILLTYLGEKVEKL